jgi:hypothetical protein
VPARADGQRAGIWMLERQLQMDRGEIDQVVGADIARLPW